MHLVRMETMAGQEALSRAIRCQEFLAPTSASHDAPSGLCASILRGQGLNRRNDPTLFWQPTGGHLSESWSSHIVSDLTWPMRISN